MFSCGKFLFFGGDGRIFKSYNKKHDCDCCLNEIKLNEPWYNITIDTFDGSPFLITVSPNLATFTSLFKQVAKKFKKNKQQLICTH